MVLEKLKRPTNEECAAHYRAGLGGKCPCCEDNLYGSWTDYTGELRCRRCGCTSQILGSHLKDEYLQSIGLTKGEVAEAYCNCFQILPILKAYWNETKMPSPFGTWFGSSPVPPEQNREFWSWMLRNSDRFSDEWADDFNWTAIKEKYAVEMEVMTP